MNISETQLMFLALIKIYTILFCTFGFIFLFTKIFTNHLFKEIDKRRKEKFTDNMKQDINTIIKKINKL